MIALFAGLLSTAVAASAQQQVLPVRADPFSAEVGLYHQSLDHGYSDWDGADVRLMYHGAQAAPFATVSSQTRREGRQASYGLGSYLFLAPALYAIADFSVATGGTAVFFPRLRWDATLFADTHVVPGLVVDAGITYVSFGSGSSGTIASLGPILYRGPWIASALAHVNHDGPTGATTGSGEGSVQYGAEGRAWSGITVSAGHEAYQVIALTPFDAQFTNIGGSVFRQQWLGRRTSLLGRLEYQDKLTAYRRVGMSLSYRVTY